MENAVESTPEFGSCDADADVSPLRNFVVPAPMRGFHRRRR